MHRRQAIVTLVVGNRYKQHWERFSKRLWLAYADRHDLEVIPLEQALDSSPRAASRSPTWQKLLILSQDFARKYERIIWVDSDIVINAAAPLITEGVPPEKVGAVDESALPSREDHPIVIRRVADALRLPPERVWPTPQSIYESVGLPGSFSHMVQAGVLVLSPRHHKDVYEHIYYNYEQQQGAVWGDMPPLSFELLNNDLVHWIDRRFNAIWAFVKALHYPWLFEDKYRLLRAVKGARRLAFKLDEAQLRKPLTTTFLNNYFLHFAGGTRDVRGLDVSAESLSTYRAPRALVEMTPPRKA